MEMVGRFDITALEAPRKRRDMQHGLSAPVFIKGIAISS